MLLFVFCLFVVVCGFFFLVNSSIDLGGMCRPELELV